MKRTLLSIASALMIAGTNSASAAAISWSAQTFDNANQVSTTGDLVQALNLGQGGGTGASNGTPTAAVTVNGVTFASTPGTGPENFVVANSGDTFDAGTHVPLNDPIVGLADADADALIDSISFGGGVGNSLARVSGLDIGTEYILQIIVAVRSSGGNATYDFGHSTPSGNATEVYTLEDVPGNPVSIVTGTFTADATSQDIHVAISTATNLEASAFQLRAVPEPGSLALFGLGGLLVAHRRRG
ncbi:MAG: PEP-CTERM sorting domain-containing protein [Planctomycetota bacterium]